MGFWYNSFVARSCKLNSGNTYRLPHKLLGDIFNGEKMNELIIADTVIRKSEDGLYCLNDLHKASGNLDKDQPRYWLATNKTKELIAVCEKPLVEQKQAVRKVTGTPEFGGGTFVTKELVYAYAMWISADFFYHVIKTYDSLITSQKQLAIESLSNLQSKIEHQANQLQSMQKREPRDENSLAVILNIPSRYVQVEHDILERHGYLTSKTFTQTYHVKTPTQKMGSLCIGRKGTTLLYDEKIKDLIEALHVIESIEEN